MILEACGIVVAETEDPQAELLFQPDAPGLSPLILEGPTPELRARCRELVGKRVCVVGEIIHRPLNYMNFLKLETIELAPEDNIR